MKSDCYLILFCTLICFGMLSLPSIAQEIVAHRGASYLAPENTLAAVKLGYALGAEAVEIDVHLTKDLQVVVIHDSDTRRTAGGNNLEIAESTAAELHQLEVGSWKNQQYAGEKIPLLAEVFPLVPEGKKLVVELKTGPEILPHLQELIAKSDMAAQLILISFNRETIITAKQRMPAIPAYWLLHNYKEHSLEEAIAIVKKHQLQGLDVHYTLINKQFMEKMQEQGLEVYVYTVNDPAVAKRLLALGVKGITTDRPGWLNEQLD